MLWHIPGCDEKEKKSFVTAIAHSRWSSPEILAQIRVLECPAKDATPEETATCVEVMSFM